jgi:hypothetical protein
MDFIRQKRTKSAKNMMRKREANEKKKETTYLGARKAVHGRMRKGSFHACRSQVDYSCCDRCVT